MKRYFSNQYDEQARSKENWLIIMEYEMIPEMELTEAKVDRDFVGERFWCSKYGGNCEVGECGRTCDGYTPRNGKSGICQHHSYFYEPTDKKIILKLEQK